VDRALQAIDIYDKLRKPYARTGFAGPERKAGSEQFETADRTSSACAPAGDGSIVK
jgi:hypothetical protein